MAKFTKSEIQRAIAQARSHLARREEPITPRRAPLPSERAATRLAAGWMKASGLDLEALDALRKQHRKELDAIIPKRSADAAKRWAKQIRATQAEVAERLQNSHATAPAGNLLPRLLLIDTPIGLVDNGIVLSRHLEAQKSFAKVRVDRRSTGFDQVSFLYLFRNDYSAPFLFDFLAVYSISGHGNLWVDGNPKLYYSTDRGEVSVDVRVEVSPASLTSDSERMLNLSAAALDGPGYWENDSSERTFSRGGLLTANGLVLQPGASAAIMVSTLVRTDLNDGHLVLNLNDGEFGFRSPGVLVVPKRQLLQLNNLPDLVLTTT